MELKKNSSHLGENLFNADLEEEKPSPESEVLLTEEEPPKIEQNAILSWFLSRKDDIIYGMVVFAIVFLSVFLKLYGLHSMNMWDEGWLIDVASRMAFEGTDPIYPLYGPEGGLKLFDKPPFVFWTVAFLMTIFGRATLPAKIPMGLGGGLLALVAYYFFSRKKEDRSVAIFASILVGTGTFITFYSRTAYIDSYIVFLYSLTALLAARAIENAFEEGNKRQAYIFLFATGVMNAINILAKVWQGLIFAPAIALYLFVKFSGKHLSKINLQNLVESVGANREFLLKNNLALGSGIFIGCVAAIVGGITSGLLVASIMTGLIVIFPLSLVTLTAIKEDQELGVVDIAIVSLGTGVVTGFFSRIVFSLFHERFAGVFTEVIENTIALDLTKDSTFRWLISDILNMSDLMDPSPLSEVLGGLISELLGGFVGGLIGIILGALLLGVMFGLDSAIGILKDALPLLPVTLLGGWLGFWGLFILLQGEFFDRDPILMLVSGVLVSIVLIVGITQILKISKQYSEGDLLQFYTDEYSIDLIFIGIAVIVAIASFFPFTFWIDFVSKNSIYPIRTPGELYGREPPGWDWQDPSWYPWLFFEYSLGWRFINPTNYDMWSQASSGIADIVSIGIFPFFIVGLYAFYKSRDYARGAFFFTWLFTVLAVHLPAEYQLNYYYLAFHLPYLAIAAKGLAFTYEKEKMRFLAQDAWEKLLLSLPFFATVLIPFFFIPFQKGYFNHIWLFALILILGTYSFFLLKVSKTIPGILTMGIGFLLLNHYFLQDYGVLFDFLDLTGDTFLNFQHLLDRGFNLGDRFAFLVVIVILGGVLLWIRQDSGSAVAVVLGLVVLSAAISSSQLIAGNKAWDSRYQEISRFILDHGGGYNYSTFSFSEAGTGIALEYYLGYQILEGGYPFSGESKATLLENMTDIISLSGGSVNIQSYEILVIPAPERDLLDSEIADIKTWFMARNKRALWVAGSANYIGSDLNSTSSFRVNKLLEALGSHIFLEQGGIFPGKDFEKSVNETVLATEFNNESLAYFPPDNNVSELYRPAPVIGKNATGHMVPLENTSLPGIDWLIKTEPNNTLIPRENSSTNYVAHFQGMGSFVVMAEETIPHTYGSSIVFVSGANIFSTENRMFLNPGLKGPQYNREIIHNIIKEQIGSDLKNVLVAGNLVKNPTYLLDFHTALETWVYESKHYEEQIRHYSQDLHPDLKFWVVINKTHFDKDPFSKWVSAYLWLKKEFQCVDDLIGIPSYLQIHVFANKTVLS